ncbi:MAG: amidohydrolase family protein [Deltaproteobacteria bacterium]|nr:amidohydrolase family protein [Deltaproteobacteria bacterium]
MPGLIDAHNHLSLDFSLPNYLERMADPLPALVLRAVNNMQADLLAGVTTSRCLGDKGFLDVECRNAIASGTIKGPRLVIAGKGIRSSAGHGFVGYPFDGPAMIRTAVRENIRQNADIIKFYITGTLPSSRGVDCFLSREEVSTIVDEAKRTGRRTAAHCIGGIGFDWCIDAGVDVIEHGYFLTEKQIDTLAQSSAKLVLTPSFFMSAKRIESMPEHLVEPHFRAAGMAKSSMQAIVRSGIPFALGTDGVHGQGAMAAEMSCLVELGASPSTALSAATSHGAAVCDLEKVTGSIDVGKAADLIGVKTNPFVDMETLTDIRCVIFNGEVMKE